MNLKEEQYKIAWDVLKHYLKDRKQYDLITRMLEIEKELYYD